MRPHQYIKNLFIFIPLFFAIKITNLHLFFLAFGAFIAFSLTASAVYIINDYRDKEEDKKHPTKRHRPIASGTVGEKEALILASILFVFGFGIITFINTQAAIFLLFYVLLNIAYSFSLKHIAILDVTIIAVGFVLRLFIGAAVTNIELSQWIVVITFLLAMFMALAKRRDDVLIYLDTGEKMRKVIDGYNLRFLDTAMAIMASVVIVAYTIYITSDTALQHMHSRYLYLTSIFVIVGVLRYLQLTFVYHDSGSPTKIILKDRFIQIVVIGWIVTFIGILY
jgi:4-hydroxybenzoate polyprenyltransferase